MAKAPTLERGSQAESFHFLEIALIACGSSGQQTVVVAAKQGCGF
jgi:hypothetical protein